MEGCDPPPVAPPPPPVPPSAAAIIVAVTILAIVALSLLVQPLLVQGEADATRIDLAARVDGFVAEMPVDRGQNIAAGQTVA